MSEQDVIILRRIRRMYQRKLDISLPDVISEEIIKWCALFTCFWKLVDRDKLIGDTPAKRKISAVMIMSEKGLFVPNIVRSLMRFKWQELSDKELH